MPSTPASSPAPGHQLPFDADALERVHFVAVGGTGMGSLAGLLKRRGLEITGSDKALYPPMSTALERWEIPVQPGFDPANLEAQAYGGDRAPDLVVIGNAVRPDNPEAQAAIASGVPYRSFSDALFELAMADKHRIVVTGTHGKTTTTTLTAYLLLATECDPSLLVGGISLDFDGSFREGRGRHFVVEGDEYDTAFFDKTPKFLHYHPDTVILTSIEFDHADIYRDLDHVKSAFRSLVGGLSDTACIVADWGYANVREVASESSCAVVRYRVFAEGDAPEAEVADLDWIADRLEPHVDGTRFRLRPRGGEPVVIEMPMFGAFNVANCTAALAVLEREGVSLEAAAAALPGFRGVKRRQEVRGVVRGVTLIDDFAHHPTAVKASIGALRARFPESRLIAVFEARTNTSRRAVFQQAYAEAFDGADRVILRRLPDEPIYSATGEPTELFSAEDLARDLSVREIEAHVFADIDAAASEIAAECEEGDVVLVMSNGDFGNIWEKILGALETR
ncbi:MAG: Mur ligase family protein [Myxococcota bacterium]|jgi:UDP-N-acetylmuramate: L-alanyl-gamma-D-glutamyl-meso-diaminopimelate ligase|nr:Mur ligase family protein [Myxococcota bacterium]